MDDDPTTHHPRPSSSQRLLAGLLGVGLVLSVVLLDALCLQWLGFPDGHLTELDRAWRLLGRVYQGLALVLVAALVLGRRRRGVLWVCLGALALVLSAVGVAGWWAAQVLDHGAGG